MVRRTWGDFGTRARAGGDCGARRRADGLAQQRLKAAELEAGALVEESAQRLLQLRAAVAQQPARDPGVRRAQHLVVWVRAQRYPLWKKQWQPRLSDSCRHNARH